MKTIKDFTPEIQAKIPEYIAKYTRGVFDGGRYREFKRENAVAMINFNYEKCGYKKPVVIVAENPLEAQVFFNYIKGSKELLPLIYLNYCSINNIEPNLSAGKIPQLRSQLRSQLDSQLDSQLRSQLNSQLNSQLRSQLNSQLYSQLNSQLDSQLYSQLDSQLNSQLRSQLYSQLNSQLYSQLNSQLRSQLDSQLYSQLNSQLDSQLYSQLNSQLRSQLYSQLKEYNYNGMFTTCAYSGGYMAFYNFIKDEFKIEADINLDLDYFSGFRENANVFTTIFSELVCVVSKYPLEVKRNQNNDIHCLDGKAVIWSKSTDYTGFECYYINGRNLPEKYFNIISEGKFTMDDFTKEENEEIKSTCIAFIQEKFGDEYLVNFFRKNLEEVDTYIDKKDEVFLNGTTKGMNIGVYTLFKGKINNEDIAYVRCYCPSTDRMFFLGVDSEHNNAKDAIASLYRIPFKLKDHIKSISRQGERFSTILTKEGKRILSTLSKEDVSNVVNISGNLYFSLMKYEY